MKKITITLIFLLLSISSISMFQKSKLQCVNLYVLNSNAELMVPVKKSLKPDARVVIDYLINYEPALFPKGTKVIDLNIVNNRAYVNLNKDYATSAHPDLLVVSNMYSIFYTLTLNEVFSIDEVQILVDGQLDLAPMGEIPLLVMTPEERNKLIGLTYFEIY